MKELLRKKDDVLKAFDGRKVTIDILVFKIRKMNENFEAEKNKFRNLHMADVENLQREIEQLRSNLRNLLFEESKSLAIKVRSPGSNALKNKLRNEIITAEASNDDNHLLTTHKTLAQTSTRSRVESRSQRPMTALPSQGHSIPAMSPEARWKKRPVLSTTQRSLSKPALLPKSHS